MARTIGTPKHGEACTVGRGHNATPEYRAWGGMIYRCCDTRNPDYHDYGARGITVCAKWRHDYAAFLADVGRRPSSKHSLDRIDNTRGYEPGNVRWATASEQQQNRRTTRWITYKGERLCSSELARRVGMSPKVLFKRIFTRHWSVERALSTPVGRSK